MLWAESVAFHIQAQYLSQHLQEKNAEFCWKDLGVWNCIVLYSQGNSFRKTGREHICLPM